MLKIAAICLVLIVITGTTIGFIVANNQPNQAPAGLKAKPDFSAILPKDKTVEDLGGWQKLTPPNSTPYYVFTDSINATAISVSQQILPETFKSATAQSIQDLAKSYSATEELDIDGNTAYIGTSTKGPQSVIFTKNGLLVLIKSQGTIENDAWKSYIKSLG